MENHQICVVGSGSFDLFLVVSHFPKEGETIQTKDSFIKNGGKGANQAVAAAQLGAKTYFAGQFGKDIHSISLKQEMLEKGVNLNYLREIEGVSTGQAIITLNDKGENQIIIVGGANIHYSDLSTIPLEFQNSIANSRLIQLQKEIPIEITTQSAQFAKKQNKLVMLDCGGRDDEIPQQLLESLTFISPNDTELSRVIHTEVTSDNIEQCISMAREKLLVQFPNLVIVLKMGSKGSGVLTKDNFYKCDSVTMLNPQINNHYKIIDTTGAGDCFTSAFCVRYCELVDLKDQYNLNQEQLKQVYQQCLLFANAAAFICITKMGAMPSQPNRKDVDYLIENYLKNL